MDIANLAEEIKDRVKSLERVLKSRLKVLPDRLLKWKNQLALRENSWLYSIEEQREQIEDHPEEIKAYDILSQNLLSGPFVMH